jgi:8-oxo-dGTP diphosphatase
VLLQRRALSSDHGGTWGLPGGARDSHETAEQAAIREAHEETGVRPDRITMRASMVTATPAGTRSTYTTVIADADELLATVACAESAELRSVTESDVANLRLHPGFAASWQRLRSVPRVASWGRPRNSPAVSFPRLCRSAVLWRGGEQGGFRGGAPGGCAVRVLRAH